MASGRAPAGSRRRRELLGRGEPALVGGGAGVRRRGAPGRRRPPRTRPTIATSPTRPLAEQLTCRCRGGRRPAAGRRPRPAAPRPAAGRAGRRGPGAVRPGAGSDGGARRRCRARPAAVRRRPGGSRRRTSCRRVVGEVDPPDPRAGSRPRSGRPDGRCGAHGAPTWRTVGATRPPQRSPNSDQTVDHRLRTGSPMWQSLTHSVDEPTSFRAVRAASAARRLGGDTARRRAP